MTDMEIRSNIRETENTIIRDGRLIALYCANDGSQSGWQYWAYNNMLYAVSNRDHHSNIWCSVDWLHVHCERLERIYGHKYFRNDENMFVFDQAFVNQYC